MPWFAPVCASPSGPYSIKKLEPLYMDKRAIALQSGGDSITVYHEFCAARDRGDEAEAHRLLELIHDYNRDDCLSTLGLRDWLVQQREASPVVEPASDDVGEGAPAGPVTLSADRQARIALERALRELIADTKPHERTPEQQAIALAAAAVQFHARGQALLVATLRPAAHPGRRLARRQWSLRRPGGRCGDRLAPPEQPAEAASHPAPGR